MSESGQPPQTRSTSTSVVYRHVTLQDGAQLQVHEDKSVFVALPEPPPIRTIVQLWRGDEARAVVVDRIIEVPDVEAGEVRGFFGIPADEAAIVAATRVGTEGLEPAPHADDDASGSGRGSDPGDSNFTTAMPAPVVVHDDADDDEPEDEPEPEPEPEDSVDRGRPKRGKGRGKKRR